MLDIVLSEGRKMASPTFKGHFHSRNLQKSGKCLWTGHHQRGQTPSILSNPSEDVDREIIHKPGIKLTASETSCVPLLRQKQITFIKQAQPCILLFFCCCYSLGEKEVGGQTNRISAVGSMESFKM